MQKILLADDSNVAQRMGKEILTREGFEVHTVSNGQAALKKLNDFVPDLILADVFMPGKSGYEICQFVKSESKLSHVPVVLLVGAMEPYDPQEGEKVKADGVITKPLQSSSLLKVVQELLAAVAPPPPPPPAPVAEPETWQAEDAATDSFHYSEPRMDIPEEVADQPAFADLLEPSLIPEVAPAVLASADPPASEPTPAETVAEMSSAQPAVEAASSSVEPTGSSLVEDPKPESESATPETADSDFWASFGGASGMAAPEPSQQLAAHDTSTESHAAGTTLAGTEFLASFYGATETEAPAPPHGSAAETAQQEPSTGASNLAGTDFLSRFEAAESLNAEPLSTAAQAATKTVWIAESVPVTEDDKKLFQDEPGQESSSAMTEVEQGTMLGLPQDDLLQAVAAITSEIHTPPKPLSDSHPHSTESATAVPQLEDAVPEPSAPFAGKQTEEVAMVDAEKGHKPESSAVHQPSREVAGTEDGLALPDTARIEHLVRQSIEKMMPQIVDRIVRTVTVTLRREEE